MKCFPSLIYLPRATRKHWRLAISGMTTLMEVNSITCSDFSCSWVILYNANLDNPPTHRKSLDQLRQELKEWEKHQRAGKNHVVTDVEAYQVSLAFEITGLYSLWRMISERSQRSFRCSRCCREAEEEAYFRF